MGNLNLVQIIGNVGNIETAFTAGGKAITKFSLAVNETWTNDQGKQEHTEWVRAVSFGKQAETLQTYVKKGDPLYISGKMKTDKYKAQDGSDRYSTSVIVQNFQFLSSKSDSPQSQQAPQQSSQEGGIGEPEGGFGDPIPF